MPPLKKSKNWWETYNQHDIGIDMVRADKENVPVAPDLTGIGGVKVGSPGSNPRVQPTNPNAELRMPSGSLTPEALIENQKGTTFTTQKVAPPATMPGEQPAAPGVPTPAGARVPPLPTNPNYDQELAAYQAEMKRGPSKQGKAAQTLFQVAQGMVNFSLGMRGQQMEPFQWLGEAKDQRRDQQATKRFAPYEAERQQQVQGWQNQVKAVGAQAEVQKTEAETAAIRAKAQREANQIDMEYHDAEGKRFQRRKGTNDKWEEIPELRDRTKLPVEQELDDGTGRKVFLTGDKLVDDVAQKAHREAQLELQKGKIAQDQLDDHRKRLESWQKDQAEINNKKAAIEAQAVEKEGEMQSKRGASEDFLRRAGQAEAEGDADTATRLRSEAEKLRQEASQAQRAAEGLRGQAGKLKTAPPPKLSTGSIPTTKQTTGTKTPSKFVTTKQLEALSRQTGKTVEQLRKMAEDENYTIK